MRDELGLGLFIFKKGSSGGYVGGYVIEESVIAAMLGHVSMDERCIA